ncbi:hypothetical protein LWM68_39950 [Niabella sp. W65]|nr:hypothetical protein [Niabella sp. W65]MCH7368370.1 hypothetical protein [Niabella sp. W65]ULT43968.1 hypothetical protein KRR40_11630 [Niabella sp. I65]
MFVYARLYKECDEFVALCDRLLRTLDSSDWKSVDIEPESQISESDADQFFQIGNFKYIGTNGDSVNLDVTDSTWQDRFIDGTYSNLSLKKLSKREFVIAFIESNNQHRKYYNKAGDQYRYRILERSGNRYLMLTQSFGSKFKYTFNLYY